MINLFSQTPLTGFDEKKFEVFDTTYYYEMKKKA